MSASLPFTLVSAFTSDAHGGNPAAIVIVTPNIPDEDLKKTAANFNQPITVYILGPLRPNEDEKVLECDIRFFASNGFEVPICGHGILATGKVLFSKPEVASKGVHTIKFKNKRGDALMATKLDDGQVEIQIPATVPGDVSDEENARLKAFIDKAFGRDVKIVDMKTGGKSYPGYILAVLDESEDLAGSSINVRALVDNDFPINVYSTKSLNPDEVFVSRMFSPMISTNIGEDHVCGSAHGIMAPYWYDKLNIKSGVEVKAKQVSTRGGNLRVVLEAEKGIVRLRGDAVVFGKGELVF